MSRSCARRSEHELRAAPTVTAALLGLFLTVLTGVPVLGLWLQPERSATDRRSTALGIVHVAIALTAVTAWVVFVIVQSTTTAGIAGGLIATTVTLGVTTLVSSHAGERRVRDERAEPVPRPALAVHATAAAVTVALCTAALLGGWG